MARGARNTITSGNGGTPKWTDEERQSLMLLHKLWDLTDVEINTPLHRCYPAFAITGRNYTYDHTRDEYRFRFRKGRSKRWHTIDRPNRHNRTAYDEDEIEQLRVVQFCIEIAAAGGWGEDEIVLTPRDGAPFPVVNPTDNTATADATGTAVEDGDEMMDDAGEETTEGQEEDTGIAGTEEDDGDAVVGDGGEEGTTQAVAEQDEELFEEFFYYRPPGFFDEQTGGAGDGDEDTAMANAGEDEQQQTAFPPRVFHIDQSELVNQDGGSVQVEEDMKDVEIEAEETQEGEVVAAPAITRRSARIREKRAA